MANRKKTTKSAQKALDSGSPRRRKGRPGVNPAEIVNRAAHYRMVFWKHRLDKKRKEWVRDGPQEWMKQLLTAKNEEELRSALNAAPEYVQRDLTPSIGLILTILREKTFPKRVSTQLDYLADSLAGRSIVTPRRSRDICGKAQAEERRSSRYKIIRYEYYIECTCGYKGPARDSTCPKCGAAIPILKGILWGSGFA